MVQLVCFQRQIG